MIFSFLFSRCKGTNFFLILFKRSTVHGSFLRLLLLLLLSSLNTASGWLAGVFLKHQVMPVTLDVQDFAKDSGCTQ